MYFFLSLVVIKSFYVCLYSKNIIVVQVFALSERLNVKSKTALFSKHYLIVKNIVGSTFLNTSRSS